MPTTSVDWASMPDEALAAEMDRLSKAGSGLNNLLAYRLTRLWKLADKLEQQQDELMREMGLARLERRGLSSGR
jgi:hypothetical protein